eukprot:307279-Prymnesium_polylepis.1
MGRGAAPAADGEAPASDGDALAVDVPEADVEAQREVMQLAMWAAAAATSAIEQAQSNVLEGLDSLEAAKTAARAVVSIAPEEGAEFSPVVLVQQAQAAAAKA